jgi:Ser/Thr protein kinase RdoA (MazF antagonist)
MSSDQQPASASSHPYDILKPDVLLDAVEDEGFPVSGRLFALNSYENRVYQIGLDDTQPVIAKFYRPGRWTEAQILEEHGFTLELEEAGVPVVAPLRLPSGGTLGRSGEFLFAVFPQRGGHAPDTSTPDTLYRLGQWLGQLHNVGASKSFKHRPAQSILPAITDFSRYLTENDWVPRDLRPAWDSLIPDLIDGCARLVEEAGELTSIRLHGDCHAGNILVREDRLLFVDQDLWLLLNGDDQERSLQFGELLEGYEMFRDFNRRERYLIEPLRCYRQLSHCAWLAQRWDDPAFPRFFPWFAQPRFWSDQILSLREQLAALQGPVLNIPGQY